MQTGKPIKTASFKCCEANVWHQEYDDV